MDLVLSTHTDSENENSSTAKENLPVRAIPHIAPLVGLSFLFL